MELTTALEQVAVMAQNILIGAAVFGALIIVLAAVRSK